MINLPLIASEKPPIPLLPNSLKCSRARAYISEVRKHAMPGKKHERMGILDNYRKTIKDNMVVSGSQDSDHHKDPPLVSALKASAEKNVASFQFPGHNRGRAAPSSLSSLIGVRPFLHDLFAPKVPILDAEKEAAKLFGATKTWFLVGGTTCGIQASVMATCSPGDTLILPRNSHISVFSSMVLSGAIPKYITPEYDLEWDIALGVTTSQASEAFILLVEKAIGELDTEGRKASAVLVTSPTYYGICSNLEEISQLCHSHNIPLIVDEAHGAHLGFHENFPLSALHQGADLSIQSTHKVLSSLTQSSMLHMAGKIVDRERICRCLQTLQSTSPSYLLLASLDAARAQISQNPETIFNKAVEIALEAKALIEKIPGITVLNSGTFSDVRLWKLGISGFEADVVLYKDYGVISELIGTRSITFAINLGTSRDDVLRLVSGLNHLSQTHNSIGWKGEKPKPFIETVGGMRLSPRDAFFASKKKVSFEESIGRISGELICPYPPGIPLLIPGEVITEEAASYLVEVKKKGEFDFEGPVAFDFEGIVVSIYFEKI
ncbi:hypothetical protein OSB04_006222 [Centaurea solstitialis]|uniref:Arginine decarboxylase n=1 Tax=Centaurea solstitialis TaxID=347529 RepID=A0AA38WHG9_9ASTR|nr:hypothetical protein OSB04_006222 [Centaurea solstitialis]